jgi:hypothetical protein
MRHAQSPGHSRLSNALVGLVLALATCVIGLAPTAGIAHAETPAELTRTVTYGAKTVTVRLHPITLRGPGFEVLVQQADGSLVRQSNVHPESGWLGGVDGDSSAIASGIIRSDGLFEGSVVFDRGATWRFRDAASTGATTVYSTRGLTPPAAYQ